MNGIVYFRNGTDAGSLPDRREFLPQDTRVDNMRKSRCQMFRNKFNKFSWNIVRSRRAVRSQMPDLLKDLIMCHMPKVKKIFTIWTETVDFVVQVDRSRPTSCHTFSGGHEVRVN